MNGNRGKTEGKKRKKSNPVLDWLWIGLCCGAVVGISVVGLCGFKSLWIGLGAGAVIGILIGYFNGKN